MFDGLRLAIGGQDRGAPAAPERQRGIFADFKPLAPAADPARAAQTDREHVRRLAAERHARAILDIRKMQDKDLPILPHQRSEEHTSELQSLMRISYAVFCLKKKKKSQTTHQMQEIK